MRGIVQLRVYYQLYIPVSSTIILIDESMLQATCKEKEVYNNVIFQISIYYHEL